MEEIIKNLENLGKDFRVGIPHKIKIDLQDMIEEEKKSMKLQNIFMKKKKDIYDPSKKIIEYALKLKIYFHNGDCYNYCKYFKKLKKICYKAIDELEDILSDDTKKILSYKNDDKYFKPISKNENAYIQFCNDCKDKIKIYESGLKELYNCVY